MRSRVTTCVSTRSTPRPAEAGARCARQPKGLERHALVERIGEGLLGRRRALGRRVDCTPLDVAPRRRAAYRHAALDGGLQPLLHRAILPLLQVRPLVAARKEDAVGRVNLGEDKGILRRGAALGQQGRDAVRRAEASDVGIIRVRAAGADDQKVAAVGPLQVLLEGGVHVGSPSHEDRARLWADLGVPLALADAPVRVVGIVLDGDGCGSGGRRSRGGNREPRSAGENRRPSPALDV